MQSRGGLDNARNLAWFQSKSGVLELLLHFTPAKVAEITASAS
jgi:hypothetical protein